MCPFIYCIILEKVYLLKKQKQNILVTLCHQKQITFSEKLGISIIHHISLGTSEGNRAELLLIASLHQKTFLGQKGKNIIIYKIISLFLMGMH